MEAPRDAALEKGSARPAADEEALRRTYDLETADLVRARLDLSLALFALCMGVVVLFESRMPGHGGVIVAYAIELVISAVAVVLAGIPRFRLHVAPIAVVATAGLGLTMIVYSAMIRGPWDPVAIGQVCLMTCLAVVVPWGWRAQVALTTTLVAVFLLAIPFLERSSSILYALVPVVASAITSCWAAYFLERYRFQAFAHAFELARAYAQQQEETEISSALVLVGETLNQFVGRSELLENVNRMVIDALGCDWSTTFVFDEEQSTFRFVANVGSRTEVRTELQEIDFPHDSMPIFEELRHGRLVELEDTSRQTLVPPELLQRWEAASMLCAPIHRHGRLIGLIGTGYAARRGPFARKQRRLLVGIGHALALGVDNERLIRDLRIANRLKSDFVATMSHELRTPLNVILGYAEMLGEDASQAPQEVEHIAGRIRRSASELLELVNATLDLGRMESGRDVLNIEPVALDALLGEIAAEFDPLAQSRGLAVRWRNGAGSISVPTDRVKLKTIVKNLVGNAIKYTQQGSVEVSVHPEGGALAFTVRDTGIGIAPADLPAIFDMFRQVDGSATRTVGGVGLGLYIVRQLVERLQGTIDVASTPGVGSTFTVRLPRGLDESRERRARPTIEPTRLSS